MKTSSRVNDASIIDMEEVTISTVHLFSELMMLLHEIEKKKDHTLAAKRFEIINRYDMELIVTGIDPSGVFN